MSATVGMRGLSVNVGKNGAYLNTGIPGTGLYDRVRINDKENSSKPNYDHNDPAFTAIYNDAVEIKSYQPELITSEGLFGLKESIINAQQVKEELRQESMKLSVQKQTSFLLMIFAYMLIFGFFIKWFKENYNLKTYEANEAKETYQEFKLDIKFEMDHSLHNDYLMLKNNYEDVMKIDTIWDITSAKSIDRIKERSAASTTITRSKVKFSKSSLDYVSTEFEALKLQNANGGDLFIYPGFIVMVGRNNSDFGLIDFRELNIRHNAQRFVETERVPNDSKVVEYTWKYVNKNGSPDKRFNNNFQIPIALYYEITIESSKGLYESYQFSNSDIAQRFCKSFETYRDSLQKMRWEIEKNINS